MGVQVRTGVRSLNNRNSRKRKYVKVYIQNIAGAEVELVVILGRLVVERLCLEGNTKVGLQGGLGWGCLDWLGSVGLGG